MKCRITDEKVSNDPQDFEDIYFTSMSDDDITDYALSDVSFHFDSSVIQDINLLTDHILETAIIKSTSLIILFLTIKGGRLFGYIANYETGKEAKREFSSIFDGEAFFDEVKHIIDKEL